MTSKRIKLVKIVIFLATYIISRYKTSGTIEQAETIWDKQRVTWNRQEQPVKPKNTKLY